MQSDEPINFDLVAADAREDLLVRELDLAEDECAHQPMHVPEPPIGIAEFALARFLFHNVCYVRTDLLSHRLLFFVHITLAEFVQPFSIADVHPRIIC